jgi:hypothetical protein
MASPSQLTANRENATHSTGPNTEAGKQTAARNALTLGLYTRADYVKPEERDLYKDFTETMLFELAPESLLEQSLAAEITGAAWRLRRCAQAEGELSDFAMGTEDDTVRPYPHNGSSQSCVTGQDPYLDDTKEKTQRSIERARAAAHSALHKSINQLRRLQTERTCRAAVNAIGEDAGLADYQKVMAACTNYEKLKGLALENRINGANGEELASICNPEPAPPAAAPQPTRQPAAINPQTPRNAPCPCRSGEKFKRCCGRNAPPVLNTPFERAA